MAARETPSIDSFRTTTLFAMERIKAGTSVLLTALLVMASGLAAAQELDPGELNDVPRERRAQTGMKFLEVSLGARASAMADAVTAGEQSGVMSMFYNPSHLGRMESDVSASVGRVQWIMDINYNYGAIGYRPANGQYGVVGLAVRSLDYGTFTETIRFDNEQGYRELGTYSPSATAVTLGYSRVISDRFVIGGNAKYAYQDLSNPVMSLGDGENGGMERQSFSQGTLAWDFGLSYRTGFRGVRFAMDVRNLATEVTYAEESFELPLTFRIGLSAEVLELAAMPSEVHDIRFSIDGERPRDFSENVRAGLEYEFANTLALRAGYALPSDERSLSLGGGVQTDLGGVDLGADYSYTSMGLFDQVHRIGIQFGY